MTFYRQKDCHALCSKFMIGPDGTHHVRECRHSKARPHHGPENQKSIWLWVLGTFGMPKEERSFERMFEEIDELRDAPLENRQEECADVLICMYAYASSAGFDLQQAVNDKMKVNRARKWKVHGDGTGHHET